VLKRIIDMPAGTLGFEAIGEVDDDDYDEVVQPALRRELAERGKLRLLYLLGPRLEQYERDAIEHDAAFVARHPAAYERVAVVSDEAWLGPVVKAISIALPGRARTFPVRELEEAKAWLAEGVAP